MRQAAAYAAWFAIAFSAQPPALPQQTFRGGTEQIRVDVAVVDSEGKPVRGLSKEDFTVLVGGQRRVLTSFTEVIGERPPRILFPPDVPLDVVDNSLKDADRLIVVVIDDLHLERQTDIVKTLSRQIVTGAGANAAIALLTTSGRVGVEFTNDRGLLLRAIERFEDKVDPFGSGMSPGLRRAVNSPNLFATGGVAARRGRTEPADLSRFFADMQTYKALQDVARMLEGEDGRRKALLWISGGLRGRPEQTVNANGDAIHYSGAFDAALDAMRRSNVVTYAIKAGAGGGGLQQMALMSGGFAIRSTELSGGVQRVIADLDHYYLLGFEPSDVSTGVTGGWQPLKVVVGRPDVSVRHRSGYRNSVPAPKRNVTTLVRLAEGLLPGGDLPLRMFATPVRRAGDQVTVAVTIETGAVFGANGSAATSPGRTITCSVVAVDLRKKRVAKIASNARILAGGPAAMPAQPDQIVQLIDLSPGQYQLRVSAKDEGLAKAGSAYMTFDVPALPKSRLSLGGIVLGVVHQGAPARAGTIHQRQLFPFEPTLDREFSREMSLQVFAPIFPGPRTQVDATFEILDLADHVLVKQSRAGVTNSVDLTFSLADLQPGPLRIRLTVADQDHAAHREIGFVLK